MKDAALELAGQYPIFPLGDAGSSSAKKPRTRHGLKDATNEEEAIRAWWTRWPNANIGVRTGRALGEWVLDVDSPEDLEVFEERHGELPETHRSRTGGGGLHLYFRYPEDAEIGNRTKVDGLRIDVRGEGGYVVYPPSVHESGDSYKWESTAEAVHAPAWLVELVRKEPTRQPAPPSSQNGGGDRYGARALEMEAERVRRSTEGERNDALNRAAFNLGQLVAGGELDRECVQERLLEAACAAGLSDREARRTIESGLAGGERTPRNRTGHNRNRAPSGRAGREPSFTDTGNAERLVRIQGARIRYVLQWRTWLWWSRREGRWIQDVGDVRIREAAKVVGRSLMKQAAGTPEKAQAKKTFDFGLKSLSSCAITSMVNLARGMEGVPIHHEDLDADQWLLGVENGTLDLRTGDLRPADPADLMTLQAPVRYAADSSAPRWERALKEWFPDSVVRKYVQRVAGSALVGKQREHVLVIHYGGGRNGKGTFIRALQRVLGPYARVVHHSLLIQQTHEQHDTVKAALFRARLAVASETEARVRLREASVKNLTGGDRITARGMRQDLWEFDPTHSLWLQTNHLPEIRGRDRGIWSRIRVVKWGESFDGREEKDLDAIIEREAPGILLWLVDGCRSWQERGLDEPEAVLRETLAYRRVENKLERFADDIGLVFRDDLEIQAAELRELLDSWSQEQGIQPPKGIADWLKDEGAWQKRRRTEVDGRTRQVRFWQGVGVLDPAECDRCDMPSGSSSHACAGDGDTEAASHLSLGAAVGGEARPDAQGDQG